MAANIGGVLIPGPTGEGWELSPAEQINLLKNILPLVKKKDLYVSVGILRTNYEDVNRETYNRHTYSI